MIATNSDDKNRQEESSTPDTKGVRQVLDKLADLLICDEHVPEYWTVYLENADQELQEIMLGMLPEKLEFNPKKNMACSFECTVLPPEKLNPCPSCGGTRIYEWGKFKKEHKIDPNDIEGYNAALKTIKQNIRGGFKDE